MNAFSTTTPAADLAPAAPSRDTAAAVAEGVREPVGGNGGAPGASSGGSDYLSPGAALLPADADGSLHNTGMAELASQYGGARLVHFISNGKPARRHCVHAGVARVATGMELYHEVYHIRQAGLPCPSHADTLHVLHARAQLPLDSTTRHYMRAAMRPYLLHARTHV
eukprot:364639-Chlamydomonas_euryale.AAC.57